MGRALMGPPWLLWAGPLWAPLGPYGHIPRTAKRGFPQAHKYSSANKQWYIHIQSIFYNSESIISHGTFFQCTFQFEDYETWHFAGLAIVRRQLSKYKVAKAKFRSEAFLAESKLLIVPIPHGDLMLFTPRSGPTFQFLKCQIATFAGRTFLNAQLSNYKVAKMKFRSEAFPRGASAKY